MRAGGERLGVEVSEQHKTRVETVREPGRRAHKFVVKWLMRLGVRTALDVWNGGIGVRPPHHRVERRRPRVNRAQLRTAPVVATVA